MSRILVALSAVLLLIVLSTTAVLWSFNDRINRLEQENNVLKQENNRLEQKNNVLEDSMTIFKTTHMKISEFYLDGFDSWGGTTWDNKFKLKIQNYAPNETEGLTLTFNILNDFNITRGMGIYNDSRGFYVATYLMMGTPYNLSVVKPGETLAVYGFIGNGLSDPAQISNSTFTATLKLGELVLDKAQIKIGNANHFV